MKEHFLTLLRDQSTAPSAFREAAHQLALLIASEVAVKLPLKSHTVQTPLAPAQGASLQTRIVLIPILRAGLALLTAFQQLFKEASIGFFGIRRNETTALPQVYYENIPPYSAQDHLILLDPMLATGGSALAAIDRLKAKKKAHILLVSVVAAPEGIAAVKQRHPDVELYTAAIDQKLNSKYFIVPGLGDFGDRFFGTVE